MTSIGISTSSWFLVPLVLGVLLVAGCYRVCMHQPKVASKMEGLQGILQSQVNPMFLHSNSTSHKWPFSAVAELIDNAYDPDVCASKLHINYESFASQPCLTFTDDGNGLDAEGMHKMLSFGFNKKTDRVNHQAVGQYGNGFKSGSMRLGRDAMVFTVKGNTKSIGFLSQTFLENSKAETVLVPIVSWRLNDNKIIQSEDAEPSLHAILEYSIFKTIEELFAQFKRINGFKGTRIIIYNIKRDNNNRLEFDLMRDLQDIIIAEEYSTCNTEQMDSDIPEHTYSLRAYCSILYRKPKLRIYLRGKKVQTLFIEKSLSRTETDTYKPKNVTLEPDRPVKITFGFNPAKNQYGMLMYHKNRLIKPYVKVGHQLKPDKRGVGVLGVVECNFIDPTHNKQEFLDTHVYRTLIQALGIKLNDYWNEKMGIVDSNQSASIIVKPEPANQPDDNWVQCDRCQKWRKLPASANMAVVEKMKDWYCEMNPDPYHSKCGVQEEPEDEVRAPYDKTYKRRQQAVQYQQKYIEEASRRKERVCNTTSSAIVSSKFSLSSKNISRSTINQLSDNESRSVHLQRAQVNEEKKKMRVEKARLAAMEKELALQREAKKKTEMASLLQKIAFQQKQIKAQEQQIQHAIIKVKPSTQTEPVDDDDILLMEEPEPPPLPSIRALNTQIITKANTTRPEKRPNPSGINPLPIVTPPKKPRLEPNATKKKPLAMRLQIPPPKTTTSDSPQGTSSPSRSLTTPSNSASSNIPSSAKIATTKIKLKQIKVKPKLIHKRVQVDEEQTEALESADESDGSEKSRFNVMSDKRNMSHSGTQVNEDDFSGCCWVCRQIKIKQEIKQEFVERGFKVKVEGVAVKAEKGVNDKNLDTPGEYDVNYEHNMASTSNTSGQISQGSSSNVQKILDTVTKERDALKKRLDSLQKERSKGDGPSVDQITEQLEESWQKVDDLQKEMETVCTEKTMLRQELQLLRQSKQGGANQALSGSIAQLKSVTKERDLLKKGIQDLERRVSQFTKTLGEKLEVQSQKMRLDFENKLKEAHSRAENVEKKASALLTENKRLQEEVSKLNECQIEREAKQMQAQEEATKNLDKLKQKLKAVIDVECVKFQERERALMLRLGETQRQKGELEQKVQATAADMDKLNKELKDAKDKKDLAVKALAAAFTKQAEQIKQVEALGRSRMEECRQQLQVMVNDAQNKWKNSVREAANKDQELCALQQQLKLARSKNGHPANPDGGGKDLLNNLRANVFDLLKTLISQEVDLDTMVTDPRSSQVDDIVQQVLDDSSHDNSQ